MSLNQDNVYCAARSGLFIYNKSSSSLSKLTRIDGLSSSNISAIGFNTTENTLIITYADGQIDFLSEGTLTHTDVLYASEIVGSKKVNAIFNQDNLSYLCTDFGVMVYDLEMKVVLDTYFELGLNGEKIAIRDAVIFSDSLFVASDQGIISGSLNDNLKDFNQWHHHGPKDGIPMVAATSIAMNGDTLVAGTRSNGLYFYIGGVWTSAGVLLNDSITSVNENGLSFDIAASSGVYDFTPGLLTPMSSASITTPIDFRTDGTSKWIADQNNGLIRLMDNQEKVIYPNGPFDDDAVFLYANGQKVVALPKAYSQKIAPLRGTHGFYFFYQGTWTNYNNSGYPKTSFIPEFQDITDVIINPVNGQMIFSSFGYGLLKYSDSGFTVVDETTSGSNLQNSQPPGRNVNVTGLTKAGGSDLWLLNYGSNTPLIQLDANNNGEAFDPAGNSKYGLHLTETPWNDIWISNASLFGGGITVFRSSSTSRQLTTVQGNGGLPGSQVNDMALDHDEKMWVATNKGVVYYPFPRSVLDNISIDPVLPIFEFNPLFRNEEVTSLAIDGGNRVWMGTNNGVWLFSEDGSKLVDHFTSENSPLLSNRVLDIAINHTTGEVFFATKNGMVSYRGTSTSFAKVPPLKIFPNPVEPGFGGYITMEGTPLNASVTITDSAGRRVFSTRANGNSATWQGTDLQGKPVNTGIYFVFISSDDGSNSLAGKISVVR